MYNIKGQVFVLEIPKNGSRSLIKAVQEKYGKNWMKCMGHHTAGELLELVETQVSEKRKPSPPFVFAAVIRNPVQRFISQIGHVERNKANVSLDDMMEQAWTQSNLIFRPQWEYVALPTDVDIDLRLWDMERIKLAMRFVSQSSFAPQHHMNKKPKHVKYNEDQIMGHKMFDELMESEHHYKPDFKLWLEAQKTNQEGKANV